MTWVAWRQQRLQILVSLGLVLLVVVFMVLLRSGVSTDDQAVLSERYNEVLGYVPMVMLPLPVLLGMFAGAPVFAREIEQGTHVFGLSQSIGRTRWWGTKLLVAGLPVVLGMFLLGLVSAWALRPLSFIMSSRLQTPLFESQGLVLGAYTAVAFCLGATAGLLVRNTLAAMAITLGGYVALLVVVGNGLRPRYGTPSFTTDGVEPGVWRVETGYLDAAGNPVGFSPQSCVQDFPACKVDQGIATTFYRFFPDSRFWDFQLLEGAVFVAVCGVLVGVGAWAVRRLH